MGDSRKIILTGFGSFGGVDANPTAQIVKHFQSQHEGIADKYNVLRVATTDVEDFCRNNYSEDSAVYVHLGVSGEASSVCLEECAYNNMTFRIPDEAGFQPQEEKIFSHCEFEEALWSELPLAAISKVVSPTHSASGAQAVVTSSDPGRFLCNYIYYHSLHHCARLGHPKHCVFIHVPPVEVLSLDRQCAIVADCIRLIREHCAAC